MNGFIRALIAATATAVLAAPAMAQDSTTIYAKVSPDGYVMQDLAIMASTEPSLQAGVTQTYGKWAVDVWTATELGGGGYGERGYGDEIDLTVSYNDTAETPFGKLTFEGSASYYLLSSFGDSSDDMLQLYADVGLPLQVGALTVTPFVRPIQWVGFDEIPNETLVRSGARFALPLSDGWSIDGDLSANFLLTSGTEHGRGQVNLRKDFGGGWSGALELKITEGLSSVIAIGGSKSF